MNTKLIPTALAFAIILLSSCLSQDAKPSSSSEVADSTSNKVVIGYIPTWKDMRQTIDTAHLDILTHINLSFLNPDASGVFLVDGEPYCSDGNSADIHYVVKKAHQHGVKVLISVAGGVLPECSADWQILLQEGNRNSVINNLKHLVSFYNLDGIDIDIEGPILDAISKAGDYTPFIQALREELHPMGKLVTCATASYVGGRIPQSSFPYFDYINIMAYDNAWNTTDHHSTYEHAVRDMQLWLNLGCPPNKLVLGLPFYAHKGIVGTSGHATYNQIVEQHSDAAHHDVYFDYRYNGIPTIKAKTKYAIEHGGGVMIWEISQDAPGGLSLLKAIGKEME